MGAIDEHTYARMHQAAAVAGGDDPYIGHTFDDRYEILSKIGEGSQARVYLGRHVLIDRLVAVKCLLPVLAADKSLVARFLNEGRAAGALGHANIVESIDMGFAPDGAPYLVLERLQGRTLAEEIAVCRRLVPSRAAYIGSQIASALSAAHARDIVHRDLKPANVLLVERSGRPDHVKVLDFGISKFNAGGSRVTTIKGQTLGTPGFMAPEQIEDPVNIDTRADVYGLGATLYDMLCGTPPFAEIGFPKILRLIVEEEPRRLSEMRPDLPVGLVEIVERAMSKSPAHRFQTMAEFEDALLGFAEEPARSRAPEALPIHRGFGTLPAMGGPRSGRSESPSSSEPRPPRSRRKQGIALAALLLFLGCLAVLFGSRARTLEGNSSRPVARPELRQAAPIAQKPPPNAGREDRATEAPAAAPEAVPGAAARAVEPREHPSSSRSSWKPAMCAAPVAVSSRSLPGPLQDSTSCNPPFYYEGKKKLFKPGCI
jgi:serine/threonine protein kinase